MMSTTMRIKHLKEPYHTLNKEPWVFGLHFKNLRNKGNLLLEMYKNAEDPLNSFNLQPWKMTLGVDNHRRRVHI